jgi:Holliday junction resolvase RusA-like endonuclease
MRRPRSHYKGNKSGPGRLKTSPPAPPTGGRQDVDNLLKFLLDSLQGLVFEDDRQVVVVEAYKVYDDREEGEGGIDFVVESVEGEELSGMGERALGGSG